MMSSVSIPCLFGMGVERDIYLICLFNISIGLLLIIIIIATASNNHSPSSATGWIAVSGAAFVFGSTGIPFKLPSLKEIDANPIIFSISSALGIFVVNFPLLIYLVAYENFKFKPFAILGSFNIIVTGIFAFKAVKVLGYAKGPAIWASIGMLTAFLIGEFVFNERISNVYNASAAIIFVISGICFVMSCSHVDQGSHGEIIQHQLYNQLDNPIHSEEEAPDQLPSSLSSSCLDSEVKKKGENFELEDAIQTIEFLSIDQSLPDVQVEKSSTKWKNTVSVGVMYCVLTGLFDGCLMIPYKLSNSNDGTDTLIYLASFGIGSIICAPSLFFIFYLINPSSIDFAKLKLLLLPGMVSGVLWALANFMSVIATLYLGMSIGFPLTQTCVLFAGLWGIFYFQEIDLRRNWNWLKFSIGLTFILIGSYFMGSSKSS